MLAQFTLIVTSHARMEIVEATIEDAPGLKALWNDQHDFHYQIHADYYDITQRLTQDWREYLQLELSNPDVTILMARANKKICGFLRMRSKKMKNYDQREVSFGVVDDIYVVPDERREKVGCALMEHAEAMLRKDGADYIEIQCSSLNEHAIDFYRSLGYDDMQMLFYKSFSK